MQRDEFLKSQKVMRLATVSGDGRPHVVPVWYAYEEKVFHVGTHTRTQKARNVGETGRAALCIDEGENSPIYGVAAECTASLIRGEEAGIIARKIVSRYMDPDSAPAKELLDDTDCVIRLVPERITSWQY